MKRQLLLMRHAKSAWNNSQLTDHQRPLNARGQRDAPAVGRYLAHLGLVPTMVIASDAQRTRETFEHMWMHMPNVEPTFDHELYLGDLTAIKRRCSKLPTDCHRALLLGHNPGWSVAVGWLTGAHVELKTADVAVLEGIGEQWTSLMVPNAWRLVRVLSPEDAHAHHGPSSNDSSH